MRYIVKELPVATIFWCGSETCVHWTHEYHEATPRENKQHFSYNGQWFLLPVRSVSLLVNADVVVEDDWFDSQYFHASQVTHVIVYSSSAIASAVV